MISRHLLIKGKVQGVFYRASAKVAAGRIGVTGWVKNTNQGDVEMICQGNVKEVEEFINWCRKGPATARVETVDITEAEPAVFSEFQIIPKS